MFEDFHNGNASPFDATHSLPAMQNTGKVNFSGIDLPDLYTFFNFQTGEVLRFPSLDVEKLDTVSRKRSDGREAARVSLALRAVDFPGFRVTWHCCEQSTFSKEVILRFRRYWVRSIRDRFRSRLVLGVATRLCATLCVIRR